MSSVFHFIKLAIAAIAGVASAVCLFVAQGLVVPLAVVSIAFSVMPE
jgi:hypothetical protein